VNIAKIMKAYGEARHGFKPSRIELNPAHKEYVHDVCTFGLNPPIPYINKDGSYKLMDAGVYFNENLPLETVRICIDFEDS
jgi:hypothetical protein